MFIPVECLTVLQTVVPKLLTVDSIEHTTFFDGLLAMLFFHQKLKLLVPNEELNPG